MRNPNRSKKTPTGSYPVGYARPPEATRFKPGQSGNPKGKRGGIKNFATYLLEEAKQTTRVTEGGKTFNMPRMQVMIKTTVAKAMRGDMRAFIWVAQNILSLEAERPGEAGISSDDRAILELFVARYDKDNQHG